MKASTGRLGVEGDHLHNPIDAGANISMMTLLNTAMATILFGYATYKTFHCRKEARPMMMVYAGAGLWSFGVYALVFVDQVIFDFMCWQDVTIYLIRPLIFVLMCAVLAATIRSGWRYDK